ncbi:hypothetical protein NL108_013677, partial [Boleophthalmus pectinirostris]
SIDFHERGKNHKENVAAKISEIKKKSIQKAKQEEKASKQFAAMEEAAMKAYEEDLKRMEREAAFGPAAETTSTTSTYQPVPTVRAPKQPQALRQESMQKKPQKKGGHPRPPAQPRPRTGASLWVEGMTSEGYTYYYNRATGESRWDKPEDIPGVTPYTATAESAQVSGVWTEAVSPEGYTYYYNTVTGESSWEKPADSSSSDAARSSEKGEGEEEPPNPVHSPEAGGQEEKTEQTSTETEANPADSNKSSVPKIQFRKRKAEADLCEQTSDSPDEAPKESEEEHGQEEGGAVSEEKPEEEKAEETPTGRFRPPNPYGTWERIKVQKDP